MEILESVLKYVQKSNPSMTMSKLIDELSKCRYSTASLIMIAKEFQKNE